jgi:hypothetical protein
MAETNPYHRLGQPGGPPAEVVAMAIQVRGGSGGLVPAQLLGAQGESTEVELLRAVCAGMGVRWGRDDLGWWAVVPG